MVDGPLNGLKVLDLSHVWAGPLAVRMLADLGAGVVRVEAPLSRGTRQFPSSPIGGWLGGEPGDEPWNRNAIFAKLMRNRRSLCLDLKQADAREVFLSLVAEADVLLENFSARAMPGLGLGWDVLRERNPRLIYVAMPGFGASGPLCDRVAFGPTVEAMSGFTDRFGYGPDEPRNTAMALMDPVTGVHAVAGVMAALRQRRRTGTGCRVELSLHEGGVTYNGPWLVDLQRGEPSIRWANSHPDMAPHGVYACAPDAAHETDNVDHWVVVACDTDEAWQRLCALLAAPALKAAWTLVERQRHRALIDDTLAAWTQAQEKTALVERLQAAGIAAAAVNSVPEMLRDPQVAARSFFATYERFDVPMPGNPIRYPGLDETQWTPCPALGAHNREVLKEWLALDDQSVDALFNSGALADAPPY